MFQWKNYHQQFIDMFYLNINLENAYSFSIFSFDFITMTDKKILIRF